MKLRILVLMFTAGLFVVGTTGCGSSGSDAGSQKSSGSTSTTSPSSAGEPDTAAIASGIQKTFNAPKARATCIGKELKGKVSAEAEQAIANGKRSEIPPKELKDVQKKILDALEVCK